MARGTFYRPHMGDYTRTSAEGQRRPGLLSRYIRQMPQQPPDTGDLTPERLFEVVYEELRHLAGGYLLRGDRNHTLQPTALVHEAYLKLANQPEEVTWENRAHFLNICAVAMRQILSNYAREKSAGKRGGGWQRVTLSISSPQRTFDVDCHALHEALEHLATLNERHYRVVVARFLGGLTVKETAHVLGVSERTVKNDWQMARAWLAREIDGVS